MIITAILNVIFGIIDFVIGLLPTANSNVLSFINSGVAYFRQVLDFGNLYFDMTSLVLALGFIITIEIGLMTYKLSKWVISMLSAGFVHSQ